MTVEEDGVLKSKILNGVPVSVCDDVIEVKPITTALPSSASGPTTVTVIAEISPVPASQSNETGVNGRRDTGRGAGGKRGQAYRDIVYQ